MCVEAMMQYNQYMQTYYSRMRIYRKSDVMFCWMAYPKETSKTCINVTIILYKTTYIYLFSFFTK